MRRALNLIFLFSLWLSISGCCSLALLNFHSLSVKEIIDQHRASIVNIRSETGSCSGFVVAKEIVATAGHCVHDVKEPLKITVNGKELTAIPFIDDDKKDLALLSVKGLDLPALALGQLPPLGERLISAGYPGYSDLKFRFEVGYLKEIRFERTSGPETAQDGLGLTKRLLLISDGIAYRGLSGGPVFDERGNVVGVLVAVAPTIDWFNYVQHSHMDMSIVVSIEDLRPYLK